MNMKQELKKIKDSINMNIPEPEIDMSMYSHDELIEMAEMNRSLRYREPDSTLPVNDEGEYILSEEQEMRYIEILESYS